MPCNDNSLSPDRAGIQNHAERAKGEDEERREDKKTKLTGERIVYISIRLPSAEEFLLPMWSRVLSTSEYGGEWLRPDGG